MTKQKHHDLHADLFQLKQICGYLYNKYCLASIYNRCNVEHTQVYDIKILALLYLQTIINTQSQREFFRQAKNLFRNKLRFIEHALVDAHNNLYCSNMRRGAGKHNNRALKRLHHHIITN